jgi:hypothetical protein
MKKILIVASVVMLCIRAGSIQQSFVKPPYKPFHLFPVMVDNKIAFIDSTGSMFIRPQYESTQLFSEGLCAVRTNGQYGFIDLDGNMIIKPEYDYATIFQENVALVYVKGKPCFINHRGELVIKPSYKSMTLFYNGRSYVFTETKKAGVIDKQGKLIVDTIYSQVYQFHSGVAIATVTAPNEDGEGTYEQEMIIDSVGHRITQAGQYSDINGPFEGYFTATVQKNKRSSEDVILDLSGRIVRRFGKGEFASYQSRVSNGIINTTHYKRPNSNSTESYETYTRVNGDLIYSGKKTKSALPFSENFAFCQKKDEYVLINRKGKEIARYDEVKEPGFHNGRALVMRDDNWGIIDTTGNFVSKTFNNLQQIGRIGDYLFFQYKQDHYDDAKAVYGIADKTGKPVMAPTFQYFDREGFVNGLLKTWVNNRITYINTEGKIVWQQDAAKPEPITLNIDYMQRCFFSVESESTGHPMDYGAEPKAITNDNHFPENQLSVTVKPEDTVHIGHKVVGIKVFLANTLKDTIVFNAQDGVLYMKTQALDEDGQWKYIDFMPHSWCGNSYHSVFLASNHYWQLAMPRYEGTFKTKLRIELTYIDPQDTTNSKFTDFRHFKGDGLSRHKSKQLKVYSDTFDGAVNPGQLWRKAAYSSSGIMDPYDE